MATNVKMKVPKENTKMPVNNRLLDLFWDLAEGEERVRIQATEKMMVILKDKQKNDETLCKELDYALKRLIKGLASSRKLARLGYATSLCQVLRTFPVLTTSTILRKVKEDLLITSHENKSDQSNIMLGRVMACLTLIQSGTLITSSEKEVGQVTELLLRTRVKKVPIHQLCAQAICQISAKVSSETFTTSVWPHLEKELKGGWDTCSPDVLLMLLTINKHHSYLVGKEFLSSHWKTKKIVSEKNFEHIKKIMMQSTADHPIIHPVCPELVKKAMKNAELFSAFWNRVVSEKLITQTMERRYLGFQLVLVALNQASTVEQVKVIFTEGIVEAIVTNLSHKDRPLHAPVKKLCDGLVSFVAGCADSDIQLTVITSLFCRPGTILFDAITSTKTIHNMVTKLSVESSTKWANLMLDLIQGKTKTDYGDFSNQTYEDVVQFALAELTRSLAMPGLATQTAWRLKLLQFLFLHAFFDVKTSSSDIPLCEVREGEDFSDRSRDNIKNALYKALDRMATYRPPGERGANYLGSYIDTVYQLTQYVQLLLASKDHVTLHKEVATEILEAWQKVMGAVEDIREKHVKGSKMGEGQAFELLFISLGLQLFSQPEDAIDILDDLHVCHKKAFIKKRRMSIKPQTEPEWVEVVTEVLLSLLSQGSHLVRVVTITVFKMLAPHMTSPALQLVLNVLQPQDEEGPLGFEDDDDEEEEEEEESGSEKDSGVEEEEEEEELEEEEESSDDDDDDDEEVENGAVDENLRNALKDALGKAAAASDDDEDEDAISDLDDDSMFKLDDALAQAFKSMVKNKKNSKEEKEKKQQLKTFKLKCLDLLNGFIGSDPPPSLALDLVFPLLEFIDKGTHDKAMADVARRATTVFTALVAPKKVLSDPMLDQETLPDIVQKLIDFSVRAHGVPLVLNVSSACLFVIRIMLGLESNNGPSPVRTRSRSVLSTTPKANKKTNDRYDRVQEIIKDSLRSFCLKRDTHLNHMLFHTMFDRQASILWPQADELLELIQNAEVRIFCRTQVCAMLAAMIKKETVEGIGEEAWNDFLGKIKTVLPALLAEVDVSDLKPRFVHELLFLLLRICSVSKDRLVDLLTPEVLQKVTALKTAVKKDTKNVCKKIVNLLESSKKRKNQGQNQQGGSPTKRAKITNDQSTEAETTKTPGTAKRKRKSLAPNIDTIAEMEEEITESKSEKKSEKKKEKAGEPAENAETVSQTPKKNLSDDLEKEVTMTPGTAKRKRKSIAPNIDTIAEMEEEITESKSEKKSEKKKEKAGEPTENTETVSQTPKKNLSDDLEKEVDENQPESKSAKKKKRKSLNQAGSPDFTTIKTPKSTPNKEGDDNVASKTSSSKKSAKKEAKALRRSLSQEDPDGIGADLDMTFTPKPKVNRRRSTRLSLMATSRGTPKE